MTTHQNLISAAEYSTFQFIKAFWRQFGYSPTIAEIAEAQSVSDTTIGKRLNRLQEKGWLTRKRYRQRSIQITKRDTRRPAARKGYDVTVVRVNKAYNMVTVNYNGLERSYIPKAITSEQLIDMYLSRGFKYCPLPGNVALLAKKTQRTVSTQQTRLAA